jgi:hypothetical protein
MKNFTNIRSSLFPEDPGKDYGGEYAFNMSNLHRQCLPNGISGHFMIVLGRGRMYTALAMDPLPASNRRARS